ncbi:hypothetical protein OROMI_029971 [Orobanche minor]
MASSSAFLRSIRRISYNYSIFLGKWTATGSGSYPRGAPHMNLSMVSSSPSKLSKYSSLWLMLPPPPASEGGVMSFKFYSLVEKKVLTLTRSEEKELTSNLMPNRRFRFRGSSLGWLALLNPHNLDLFLYNPISRRHIKLPPVRDLPNFPKHRQRDVTKVILSCSPDEDDGNCSAVIIYNCINSLAFCCPGHSEKWTPFGEMRMWWDGFERRMLSRGCRDCVYSTRQNVFFCLTNFGELESWDLQDTSSPRVLNIKIRDIGHFNFVGKHQCINLREMRPKELGRPVKHLVVADQDLLLVAWYIMEHVGPDGSYVDCLDVGSRKCPYRTVCFNVHKYDIVKGFLDHIIPAKYTNRQSSKMSKIKTKKPRQFSDFLKAIPRLNNVLENHPQAQANCLEITDKLTQ